MKALKHGVIHPHVVCGSADGVRGGGVPEDDVGVAAGGEHTLLGMHAEDTRRCGGNQLHKAVERNVAQADAVVMKQLQTVLDAGTAIGNLGEIVLAQRFLIFKTERAMVR